MKSVKSFIVCIKPKNLPKTVYNNIMNLIKLLYKMHTTIMNSDPQRLLLNLLGKINLKRTRKYVALSNLRKYYTWKNIKQSYKNNKFKMIAPMCKKNLNYPMDHILYQIFKIILSISFSNRK